MMFKVTVSVKYECDDIDIKYGSGLSCFLLFDPNPNIPTPDLLQQIFFLILITADTAAGHTVIRIRIYENNA